MYFRRLVYIKYITRSIQREREMEGQEREGKRDERHRQNGTEKDMEKGKQW